MAVPLESGNEAGCARLGLVRKVWPRAGPVAIAALGDTIVVAGYDRLQSGPERLYLVRVRADEAARPLSTWDLPSPVAARRKAAPGLGAVGPGQVLAAAIDASAALLVAELGVEHAGAGRLKQVGTFADARFAPAVGAVNGLRAVAYTDGHRTPMRARLVLLRGDGSQVGRHDLTPEAMGAAAPVFVDGAGRPELLWVDPRRGISPLVRVALAPDGTPEAPSIVGAVGSLAEGPQLAAVGMGESELLLGYTAIGSAATSAVGLVRLSERPSAPEPLVPGKAYVRLRLAAAALGERAVFAVDAPRKPGKNVPREIQLRVVRRSGMGGRHVVRGPDGAAHEPALTSVGHDRVALAFSSQNAVHVAWFRCR